MVMESLGGGGGKLAALWSCENGELFFLSFVERVLNVKMVNNSLSLLTTTMM